MGTTHGDVRIGGYPRRCCTQRKGAVHVWPQEASSGFGRRSSVSDRDKRDIAGPKWTRRTRHSIHDHWRTERGSHTHRRTRHNETSSATTRECASSCAPCACAMLVARRLRNDDASHSPSRASRCCVTIDSVILRAFSRRWHENAEPLKSTPIDRSRNFVPAASVGGLVSMPYCILP